MSTLADQIGDHPVLLAPLDRLEIQRQQFGAAEPAANQHGDHRVITQAARCRRCRGIEKPPALLGREPVTESNADASHAFHAANARRQLGTQETGVGSLVRHAPNRGELKVDGGRRIAPLFEVDPVPEDDSAVERKAWLRTVPGDELANGVVVGPLAAGRRQAVQHRCLGVFEIRERQDALRPLLFCEISVSASVTASFTVADSFTGPSSLGRQSRVISIRVDSTPAP